MAHKHRQPAHLFSLDPYSSSKGYAQATYTPRTAGLYYCGFIFSSASRKTVLAHGAGAGTSWTPMDTAPSCKGLPTSCLQKKSAAVRSFVVSLNNEHHPGSAGVLLSQTARNTAFLIVLAKFRKRFTGSSWCLLGSPPVAEERNFMLYFQKKGQLQSLQLCWTDLTSLLPLPNNILFLALAAFQL